MDPADVAAALDRLETPLDNANADSAAGRAKADRAAACLVQALAQAWGTSAEAVVPGWLMRHPASISPRTAG